MNKRQFLFIVNICFISVLCIHAQNAKVAQIKDILKNPICYNQEEVEVNGLVIQYIEATKQTTSHYYLKDDYGAIIKVHTAEGKPETNAKYIVKGVLYIEHETQLPFISEREKTKVEPIIITESDAASGIGVNDNYAWWKKNWLYILIVVASALIIILLYLLGKKKKDEIPASVETGFKPSSEGQNFTIQKENLKTMVIPASVPKTMKFIPGELEVLTGDDKGRIIKIGGYPTEEGSIVTIGRERVTGPRDFAHIQLKERTISRRQAEIILKDGKLYIKNLSETNYTKLDGNEILPNTSAELITGSVLTFGEVEMKYKI